MDGHFKIYKMPEPGHTYTMTVDVSEGTNLDSSTFSIFDVTTIPYRQVATYRNNKITPFLFPAVILQAATMYNDAFVLVEINSIGLQVADILHFELAYENLIKIEVKGKQGQQQSPGFKKKIAYGIKTSLQTKNIGCANLKTLIEADKLIVNDEQTIMELMTFSLAKKTFSAEEGNNDDMAMTLVHFGWLTSQRYFKENINNDIRQALQLEQMHVTDTDILPLPVIVDGLESLEPQMEVDQFGTVWVEDLDRRFYPSDLRWPNKP
jgi:Terminase RNaseH-like domain